MEAVARGHGSDRLLVDDVSVDDLRREQEDGNDINFTVNLLHST